MRVSHETIYTSIYLQGKGNLRRELHTCLRTGRALRKPQHRPDERRGRIHDMVNISQRPPEAEDRAVPGHWLGDLILCSTASASGIGTVVERATRFVMLLRLPDDYGALAVQEAIVAKVTQLPAILRKTLTWDQGRERDGRPCRYRCSSRPRYVFLRSALTMATRYQEDINGLLRQYFDKGTELSVFAADYLDYVAAQQQTPGNTGLENTRRSPRRTTPTRSNHPLLHPRLETANNLSAAIVNTTEHAV